MFLIFDLSNKESFNDVKSYWINEVESYTDESAILVLVGNKADGKREVSEEEVN